MSLHFEPGEFRIIQNDKEVGRLVALADPDVEHWFLYHDVPELEADVATYTAPSRRANPPSEGRFGEDTKVEWTFKPLGGPPPDFSVERYLDGLRVPGRVRHISAAAVDCASLPADQGPQDPDPKPRAPSQAQIWWGEYNLLDSLGNPVGAVIVPQSGLHERWFFSVEPPRYDPPHPRGDASTFALEYVGPKLSPPPAWRSFCVRCSSPV